VCKKIFRRKNMSYFFELEIGLCNAWIGAVIAWLSGMAIMLNRQTARRLTDMSWYTQGDKYSAFGSMFFMYVLIIFSIWIPMKTGTVWFYAGVVIYAAGYICNVIAMHNYATTPHDEPVVKGMYRVSRNPLYFFYSVMFLGLCVASASVPLFIVWIMYNIPTHFIILGEERYCLETYGDSFWEFMGRVPRYFIIF